MIDDGGCKHDTLELLESQKQNFQNYGEATESLDSFFNKFSR
jgi:hypothetical protein